MIVLKSHILEILSEKLILRIKFLFSGSCYVIEEYFLYCFLFPTDILSWQGGCAGNHLYWFQLSWQKGNTHQFAYYKCLSNLWKTSEALTQFDKPTKIPLSSPSDFVRFPNRTLNLIHLQCRSILDTTEFSPSLFLTFLTWRNYDLDFCTLNNNDLFLLFFSF